MILYHFTSRNNWKQIRDEGMIKMSPAPLHPTKVGRPVVWLTTADTITDAFAMGLGLDPIAQHLTDYANVDKTRVRLTVEVSRTYTHRWDDWAKKHGGHPGLQAVMRRRCSAMGTWRVHTKPIPRSAILDVIDVDEAKTLPIVTPRTLGFRPLGRR